MKHLFTVILALITTFSFAQEDEEQALLAIKKANDYIYQGNEKALTEDYIAAEMDYRKAISEQETNVAGAYNLGSSYYKKGNFDEALYRLTQAAKNATNKANKHKAYHNIGNILMQNKKCKEAVEAYINALRNNPSDEETRYNLGLAKECAKQQEDQQDQNEEQENKDENKDQEDQKDKEGDNKEDQEDKGEQDKKEGEDQEDENGKPKDDKQDQGKEGDNEKKEKQQPQQQPGQLSPQQIKNLLEAMNNQEEKVQEKINAEKQKGVKIQTEKDW